MQTKRRIPGVSGNWNPGIYYVIRKEKSCHEVGILNKLKIGKVWKPIKNGRLQNK